LQEKGFSLLTNSLFDDDSNEKDAETNLYVFVDNDGISRIDLFGLWSPGGHDAIFDHAFKGRICDDAIQTMKLSSRQFDRTHQSNKEAYMHSMRHMFQSKSAAMAQTYLFIEDRIKNAHEAAMKGLCLEALRLLGEALHPVQDRSSPEHTNPDGTPRLWSTFNPYTWANHSPNDHLGKETKHDITEEIFSAQDTSNRAAYDRVMSGTCCEKKFQNCSSK
jgi:hypothetical protein